MNDVNAANFCRPDVILVIDDVSEVLDGVQGLLQAPGIVVHAASNPIEGVKSYETTWRGIRLLLSDSFAQTLKDDEVIEYLQRMNPTVRVAFISSRNGEAEKKSLDERLRGFLQKPLVAFRESYSLFKIAFRGGGSASARHHEQQRPTVAKPRGAPSRCIGGIA